MPPHGCGTPGRLGTIPSNVAPNVPAKPAICPALAAGFAPPARFIRVPKDPNAPETFPDRSGSGIGSGAGTRTILVAVAVAVTVNTIEDGGCVTVTVTGGAVLDTGTVLSELPDEEIVDDDPDRDVSTDKLAPVEFVDAEELDVDSNVAVDFPEVLPD